MYAPYVTCKAATALVLHGQHLPWCCMGDFNELLHTEEKKGGRIMPHNQMQAFRDALDYCGFVDFGFTGP